MILRHQESYTTQIWTGVGVIGALMVLVGALSPKISSGRSPMADETVSYNYEMPRVETEDMPFDLSDREVHRRLRELEALKKKKADAAKPADATKAKVAAAAAAKKAAEAKAKQAAAARAKAMSVRVTEASDRFHMKSGPSEPGATSSSPNYEQIVGYAYTGPAKSAVPNKQESEDDSENLTAAQWRALLIADPSNATIAKFLKSRSAGKVEESTVVEIVRDLLKDGAPDRNKAAMTLIAAGSSALMFEFLVKEKAEFAADLQSELQVHIEAYASPAKLIFLGPVLASATSEPTVLSAAMEQIQVAVTAFKKSQSGNITQSGFGAPTLGQLQIFLATLKLVGQNEDGAIAQLAQTLTEDIQGLRTQVAVASASLRRQNRVASQGE